MPVPEPREALDVVRRLEDALVALERSFAALVAAASAQRRETGSEAPDMSSSPERGEVGRGAPAPRTDHAAPLTPAERRRLAKHLEALLEEVCQLADFLASDDSDPDPPKPG